MLAEEKLREGDLEAALAELQGQVRKQPDNAKYRIFLFQLLAVLGRWDRALNQLNVAGELDADALAMVQTYREALRCEVLRARVFAGERSPLLFGDPQQWVALLLESLRLATQGQFSQSQDLREQALEAAPGTAGNIDGQDFQWIADADSRLGPILEAIVNGNYYWIPFQNIHTVQLEEPADLRDTVWTPAYFTWANGGETVGLIPTRYPGSETSEDDQIRLARKTQWTEQGANIYFGLGQRLLMTDADDYPLMDIRLISLESIPPETTEPAIPDG